MAKYRNLTGLLGVLSRPLAAAGLAGLLMANAAMAQTAAPQLTSIALASPAVLTAGTPLSFAFAITPGANAIYSIDISCQDSSGFTRDVVQTYEASGQASLASASSWLNGGYSVAMISITDSQGNEEYIYPNGTVTYTAGMSGPGSNSIAFAALAFAVAGGVNSVASPQLNSVLRTSPAALAAGSPVSFAFAIIPGSAPIFLVDIHFVDPSGNGFDAVQTDESSGTAVLASAPSWVNGNYSVTLIDIRDSQGRDYYYYPSTSGPVSFPALAFAVTGGVNSVAAPVLTSIARSSPAALAAGSPLSFAFAITPGTNGIAFIDIHVQDASGLTREVIQTNQASGTATLASTPSWLNGNYAVTLIDIRDSQGRDSYYYPPVTHSISLAVLNFTVTGGLNSVIAAQLTAITLTSPAALTAGDPLAYAFSITPGTDSVALIDIHFTDPTGLTRDVVQTGEASGTATLASATSWLNGNYLVSVVDITDSEGRMVYYYPPVTGPIAFAALGFTLTGGTNFAPSITLQPNPQTVGLGASATFTVAAIGAPAPAFQWWRMANGAAIWSPLGDDGVYSGTGTATLTVGAAAAVMGGDQFECMASNSLGSALSVAASLTVVPPPSVVTQPSSQSVNVGQTVTFSSAASNSPTYQWTFNGNAIPGATGAVLTLPDIQLSAMGAYAVIATDIGGSTASASVALEVIPTAALTFTLNPVSQTIALGRSVAFNAIATGASSPAYQWTFGGTPIPGATDPILEVQGAAAANAGTYACVATNAAGSITSAAAVLTVDGLGTPGYLDNISARGDVGIVPGDAGPGILFAGVGLSGSGTKSLLIRGVGPGLATSFPAFFTPSEVVTFPQLLLLTGGAALVAQNNGWGGTPSLTSAFIRTGAFMLPAGSADAALLVSLPVAIYNIQVITSGTGAATGTGLVEVYDADAGTPTAHIVNLSSRDYVGTGSHILIGGFVIGGTDSETLLIRSLGPSLSTVLDHVLARPTLTIISGSNVSYANTGWGGDPVLAAAMATVGAYAINPSSQDSALLISLPPGSYTVELTGLNGTTGQATLEFYDVP